MANQQSTARISRLAVPDEQTLPEDLRELFEQSRAKPGFVPHVYQAYSLRPQQLRGFNALYNAIMLDDSGLSKAEREMIAVAVSAQNHCFYCLTSHGAALRVRSKDVVLADTVAANYRAAALSPRQRAMLDFAHKLTATPAEVGAADRRRLARAGFSARDIWDISAVTGFFNMTNRHATATDMMPNPEYHARSR